MNWARVTGGKENIKNNNENIQNLVMYIKIKLTSKVEVEILKF